MKVKLKRFGCVLVGAASAVFFDAPWCYLVTIFAAIVLCEVMD